MGGGKRGVGVIYNAQHAQGASTRVHEGGEWGVVRIFQYLPLLRKKTRMAGVSAVVALLAARDAEVRGPAVLPGSDTLPERSVALAADGVCVSLRRRPWA
jgi:hypothetical protein